MFEILGVSGSRLTFCVAGGPRVEDHPEEALLRLQHPPCSIWGLGGHGLIHGLNHPGIHGPSSMGWTIPSHGLDQLKEDPPCSSACG